MKVIQINQTGNPDNLHYLEFEKPTPNEGQVLVKISAIGVTFGDIMVQRGVYPIMPNLPATLGFECSGIVESVGSDVNNIAVGQSVAILGTAGCYAEFVVAEQAMVIPIPDSLDKDIAAAFPTAYLTAYHLLHSMGQVKSGQSVLVYGAAGGVGTAVIQLAKLAGVNVIGLSSSNEKTAFAKLQGADYVINYKTEDVISRVKEITGGVGVNLVLNSLAGKTFDQDFELLAPMGQIIWFGFASGYPESNLTETLGNSFMKSAGIRTFTLYNVFENTQLFKESVEILLGYLEQGKIKPNILKTIPLSDARKAHELMESSQVKGRVILKP
ncbi:Quinone oxidoreductase [hydrothermal vent metagenome]|uniref:Quinone oxidoreductase n=1 Tax=hydrothermal vent metagenome TaxID=652676 RepID=A0A3B0YEN7_9ZZZZ